jgi:hypothetical protein
MHQFLMHMLSMRISCPIFHTLSMALGTDACAEHTLQKLMHALSICVRYLRLHRAQSLRKYAKHAHQELMRTMRIRVRN